MKRSQAISLVLLAGAGAAAFGIAALDPSQDEEDVLIYRTAQECGDAKVRPGKDCSDEFDLAEGLYRTAAPRYGDRPTCEAHHGPGHCRPSEELGQGGEPGSYSPVLAAYMIGRSGAQQVPPQPLYEHKPEDEEPHTGGSSSHGGGYCTGSGARVASAYSYGASTVPRTVSRQVATTPRVIARGGLGFTGRGISAGGGHGTSGS